MRRRLRIHVALVLAGSLVFALLPLKEKAQTKPADQSLSSLIGLLLEAESMAGTEMMKSQLKEVREAANHASKGNLGRAATATEMLRVRTMLRQIVDNPRGENAELQEKIASSLKLVEDYLAMGDGNGLRARTDTAFGLTTTTFDTLEGTVSVNLPDDVAAGDTVSGTVTTEPKGATKDEQAKNEDSLNGYVVEVARQETPTEQKRGSKWQIPPAIQNIPVVLKNRAGKEVARTQVPVSQGNVIKPKPNGDIPNQGNYSTPTFGQAGRPVSVNGPFDGDFGNTYVKLGNNTAQFLAESPRKVVVRSPANTIGQTTIEVNEQNKVVARCSYQSVGIRLAADKLNLIRGEQTMLSATLSGLDGVTSPVSMQLTNATPWTVRMEGGETQTITAQPQEFTGGVWTAKRTLTGVRAGGFSINAVIDQATLSANDAGLKACARGAPGPENISKAPGPENLAPGPENARATPRSGILNERPADKIQTPVLSEKNDLKNFRLDEPTETKAGILPDLTVEDMCLSIDPSAPTQGLTVLHVLVANIGTRDSDPFELGIKLMYFLDCNPGQAYEWGICPASGLMPKVGYFYIDRLPGFEVGEAKWFEYNPTWYYGVHLVGFASRFQVIADPGYDNSGGVAIKSKIIEANKKNNTLTIDRTAMRRCDAKTIEKEPPRIPVKPPGSLFDLLR